MLHGDRFVMVDRTGTTVFADEVVGVVDDAGRLRLEFADGQVLEAPWRAFTHAGLRQLRRRLRSRLGVEAGLQHVPMRATGRSGAALARGSVATLFGIAVVLAVLPLLLSLLLSSSDQVVGPGGGGARVPSVATHVRVVDGRTT